jgi:hypothetical protein
VYQERRQNSDRNRLLDRMTARFPAEKKVLMLAGQACLERKAYKRGLDYLTQALALDRLDPAIPDNLVKARLLQARDFFQKSRPDDARMALGQTAPFEVPTPDNLTRSRWCLRIQQGLMETVWGDPARGGPLLEEGRRESPSEAAFLLYAGCADLEIRPGTARQSDYLDKFARLKKSGASLAQAAALTRIWLRGKESLAAHVGYQWRQLLENYLRAAAKRPFSREDARRLVEFCYAEDDFRSVASTVVEKRLREDANDPLFRLYRWRLRRTVGPRPAKARTELESILAEAARRKDEQTVRQVRQQLEALNLPPPMPAEPFGGYPPPEDDFDDYDDYDDDAPDFGGGTSILDELFGSMPHQQTRTLEDIVRLLALLPERELKRLRQNLPPGMSSAEFEVLAAMVRVKRMSSNTGFPPGGFPPRPPPPPTTSPPPASDRRPSNTGFPPGGFPPPPPKTIPPPDSDQPELFDP